jgi:CRP/FNR family cyclic AMP-dependent transcriptional regulator
MTSSFNLKRIPLFSELSETELERIYPLLKRRRYPKGHAVIKEGERGDVIYLIEKGQVKVKRQSLDGREKILDILSDGAFFGELSVLDEMPRSATVETMGDVSILTLHKNDFLRLLEELPPIAVKIIRVLSRRLRAADSQIEDLTFKSSREKIESMFIKLRDSHGVADHRGVRLAVSLTHQELADMAGCSRETVCRYVKELKDSGCLTVDDDKRYIFLRSATAKSRPGVARPVSDAYTDR